jgi:hypothetical protein
MASIHPNPNFNAESAAKELRAAMKGLGTDEEAIISVLVKHSACQRLEIKSKFTTLFGRDLIDDLKSELGGHFEDAVIAMMTPTPALLAKDLRAAMKGAGTDESTLIEILSSRSNADVKAIKEAYHKDFSRDLDEDLGSETSGYFKRLLISLCNAGRDESQSVDTAKALQDAKDIYEAGEGQYGTDESAFNLVLCSRSTSQLRATFNAYKQIAGRDIEDSIISETSGTLQEGYLAIVKYTKDSNAFFAERLYKSMKGAGTEDSTLIRLIVTRSEIDLATVAKTFARLYGQSLTDFIASDCSGDYRRLLIAVVGNH